MGTKTHSELIHGFSLSTSLEKYDSKSALVSRSWSILFLNESPAPRVLFDSMTTMHWLVALTTTKSFSWCLRLRSAKKSQNFHKEKLMIKVRKSPKKKKLVVS